jgi:hypothetical protein
MSVTDFNTNGNFGYLELPVYLRFSPVKQRVAPVDDQVWSGAIAIKTKTNSVKLIPRATYTD